MVKKTKLKLGDLVQVISGKDRGKTGNLLKIDLVKGRAFVAGCNLITKSVKSNPNNSKVQSGLIRIEGSIDLSNLMLVDPKTHKPTRVSLRVKTEKGLKIKERVSKRSGGVL